MQPTATDNLVYPMGQREFKVFRTMIHEHTGIWLRDGKRSCWPHGYRGVCVITACPTLPSTTSTFRTVPGNSEEIRELINCVTTNKTSFFRERHHFDFLANIVVPEMQAAALRGGAEKHPRVERRLLHRRRTLLDCDHFARSVEMQAETWSPAAMHGGEESFLRPGFCPARGRLRWSAPTSTPTSWHGSPSHLWG